VYSYSNAVHEFRAKHQIIHEAEAKARLLRGLEQSKLETLTISKNLRGSKNQPDDQDQNRMQPLRIIPRSGYLVIESFGIDSTCDDTKSVKVTGIPAGQCLNFGKGKGSFVYQYNMKMINYKDVIQVSANFYDDDECHTFGFRQDEITNYMYNTCTEDSSPSPAGHAQYLKYYIAEGDSINAPYHIGYETR
jgi:hypothetical protein